MKPTALKSASTRISASLLTVKNAMLPFIWTSLPILLILQDLPEKNRGCMQNWLPEMVDYKGMLRRWESLIRLSHRLINKTLLTFNISIFIHFHCSHYLLNTFFLVLISYIHMGLHPFFVTLNLFLHPFSYIFYSIGVN